MKFTEVLDLAGYSDYAVKSQGKNWELYNAKLKHIVEETSSSFLFLNSRATWESIAEARKILSSQKIHVVVQNSAKISADLKRIKDEFKNCTVRTVRELLTEIILRSIQRGTADPEEIKYFIDPDVVDRKTNVEKKALDAIQGWLDDSSSRRANVAVLKGKPGVGKTTLAKQLYQHLSNKIAKDQRIPIIIMSAQWSRFALNTSLSLWDIWKEAMMYSNITDQREVLFESCTKSGALLPIFDGFDELCSLWSHQFHPRDVIDGLIRLTENEEGKILLTSRDVFWEENISAELSQKLEVFELQPFNKQQLSRYLEKRFPKDFEARARAKSLISEYEKIAYAPMDKFPPSELRLGNVPVVIDLLSGCAEDPANSSVNTAKDPIYEIIKMLCRRERNRQQIQTDEDAQIGIFKDIAINYDRPFTEEELEFWAQCSSEEFSSPSKMKAFHSHPLVDKFNSNYFVFRYEFMPIYLRALYTAENLFDSSKYSELNEKIFSKYTYGTTTFFDYLEDILVRKCEIPQRYDDVKNKLAECIKSLSQQPHWQESTSNILLHLILRIIYRYSQDLSKKDRTSNLLSFFNSMHFEKIKFAGLIKNLDFKDMRFENCIFSDVTFNNCDFSENTELTNCKLHGKLTFDNCSGIKKLHKLTDCPIDPETRDMLYGVIDSIKITPQQIEKWIYDFLKKFKSGIYFIKLGYNQLFRGIVFQKFNRENFLHHFTHYEIITSERGSAGDDELYFICNDSKGEVSSFLENGIIGGKIKKVYDILVKDYVSK